MQGVETNPRAKWLKRAFINTLLEGAAVGRLVTGHKGGADGRKRVLRRWAVAKLVRHQALDLAFEGSNPSRPAQWRTCG